jgi:hypothetical protein
VTGITHGTAIMKEAIYIASRASLPERSAMWRAFRRDGVDITSSWIDEAGEGETDNFAELWNRIRREVAQSDRLVLYAEQGDFPLKGALIEVGMALAYGLRVTVCLPGVILDGRTHRPIGSWIEHRLVTRCDDIGQALFSAEH